LSALQVGCQATSEIFSDFFRSVIDGDRLTCNNTDH
jgi:hypothetical protein